jgi:dihydrolipoamide dehydrogenase
LVKKDVVVIGGGPGGYVAAIHAAHLGVNVSLVEKDCLGGTCLNKGCIPTKVLIKSVEVFLLSKRAGDFGVETGRVTVKFPRIMERKNRIVENLRKGIEQLVNANRISLHHGVGHIKSPNLIEVDTQEIVADKIIIATGSRADSIAVPGIDLPGVLSTDDILEINELPESLIVAGGGYVGVEFACIFNALGTKVTIVEKLPECLDSVDHEIRTRFIRILRQRGIEIMTGTELRRIQREGKTLTVQCKTNGTDHEVKGDLVLIAAGRRPYTEELGLMELGMEMDGSTILVNKELETNIPGIYAIGDVNGKNMLAHVASYEARIAVENALGRSHQVDYGAVPNCIFTQPEISGVGVTEDQARSRGISYKVSKFRFHASSRAVVIDETEGLIKLICDAKSGRIIGMHILGPHASELLAEGVLSIKLGATAKDLANIIHAHPTLSEIVHEVVMGQLEGSIHYLKGA